MDNFQKKFIEEATDLINNLEESLLTLEQKPDDKDLIAAVFRIMHSLKGGGGMFGFDAISNFTHNLETIYDEVRNDRLTITEDLLSITFSSVDHLRNLLSPDALEDKQVKKNHEILLARVEQILQGITSVSEQVETKEVSSVEKTSEGTYFIQFIPNENIMDNGTNPLYLIDELCDLGKGKVYPRLNKIPILTKLLANKCYTAWDVFLATEKSIEEIRDVFIFVEDESKLEIIKLADYDLLADKEAFEEIDENYEDVEKIDVKKLREFVK
ncbi:MAG: chemotaxis protein CheA, partial [Chloroflexia bacterium]|nr:chemotaxis protein CheA [Chloroflexia bacterium]